MSDRMDGMSEDIRALRDEETDRGSERDGEGDNEEEGQMVIEGAEQENGNAEAEAEAELKDDEAEVADDVKMAE
jgi:hypothetical protein